MNVLILPVNIASQPAITAEALNRVEGVNALCITNFIHPLQSLESNTIYIPKNFSKRKPLKWLYYKLTYKREIKKYIKWADIIHYVWGPAFNNGDDVKYAYDLGKPIFVEWLGSDIRNY